MPAPPKRTTLVADETASFPAPGRDATVVAAPPLASTPSSDAEAVSGQSMPRVQRALLITAKLRPLARRPRMLAAIGGAIAIATLAIVVAFSGDSAPPQDGVAQSSTAPSASLDTTPAIALFDALAAKAEAAQAEPEKAEPEKVEPEEAEPAGAEPEKAEPEKAAPAKVEPEVAAIVVDDAPAPAPTREASREGIVFAPAIPPKRRFAAAAQQCEAMSTGDARWRLPTLGELHTLTAAHAIERGVYWSGTESDTFGTRALVWSEKKTAAMPITKKWKGARAVCVRD